MYIPNALALKTPTPIVGESYTRNRCAPDIGVTVCTNGTLTARRNSGWLHNVELACVAIMLSKSGHVYC